jgi:hypothetical protein
MKLFTRGAFAVLALSLLASGALAAQGPETDSLGRVVRDASGARKNYGPRADGRTATLVAPAAATAKQPAALHAASKTGTVRAPAAAAALSTTYAETWRFNTWSYGIGMGGFWPVDINADGDKEIVYGVANAQWAIADYVSASHDYRVIYKSPMMTVSALRVVEVGNSKTVWVAGNSDGIRVYNVLTQELVATLPLPQNVQVIGLEFGDGNNDGTPDVIALATDRLLFFNAITMQPEPTVDLGSQMLVQGFALGNVDDDADREFVLNDGRVVRVNGATLTVEWDHGSIFGYMPRLADIDGDGRDELIANMGWSSVQAWDLDQHALKWDYPADHDVSAVRAFDVTGDGIPEVLIGDGQWGSIHALNGNSGTQLWAATNPEHSVTDIGVCDPDGDGVLELMWGAGYTSSGPDYLYVINVNNRAVEFQSFDISNYFTAADVGDVDNDGRAELVVASDRSDSGYEDGVVLIFDAVTHELEYRGPTNLFHGYAITGVHALRLANVDADPQPEILVATDRLYDGALFVVDGLTHAVEHEWSFDSGSPLQTLDVADVDNDGQLDVVAANSIAHSGSPGTFLYAINPRTGATIWKSQSLGSYVRAIHVADVGAPGLDVVAAMGKVLRVRWSDKQQTVTAGDTYGSALPLDVTGSSALEIVAGRYDGGIDVLDGETLTVLTSYASACPYGVTTLIAHGPHSVAYTCGSEIRVYDLDTSQVIASADTSLIYAGVNGALRRFTAQGKSAFLVGGEWPAVFTDLGGNSVPMLNPLSATLHWRGSTDLQVIGSDVNGDALTFQIAGLPALGTATLTNASTGALHYVAGGINKGADSIAVRAYDGFQFSDMLNVALTLTNTGPTTTTTTLNAHWRGTQTLRVTSNDANGDPLTISLGVQPTHGALAVSNAATGDVSFTPSGAFIGADSFSYQVSDGADTSTLQTVQFNLTNSVPTAVNPTYSVVVGSTTSGRVNGTDANSDPLTYALLTAPSRGTLTLDTATGLFDYVPATGTGSVTAQIAVRDGVSESAPVTVTFNYPAANSSSGGGGKGGGGSLDWMVVALLAAIAFARIRRKRA